MTSNVVEFQGRDVERVGVMRRIADEITVQNWIDLTRMLVGKDLLPAGAGAMAQGVEDGLTRTVGERGIDEHPASPKVTYPSKGDFSDGIDEVDVVDGQDVAHG